MSPPQAWHCALNSPIKRCSVLVPSVSPVCLPAPGVGGASQPYLPCNQACVPRGGSCLAPHPLICPCPVGPGTAMDGQLLPVLLLLLGASGLWAQGPGPEGPLEEPPEEEPPEEDGILVLSRQTLGLALREHPALLVEFCECLGPVGLGDPQGPPGGFYPPMPRPLAPTVLLELCQKIPEAQPWG